MRNLATTVLTILLLTLFQPAGGCSPPIESKDMRDFNLTYRDPMELRARGANEPSAVVEPIEPRKGPWSGNSQLGQSQPFEPDAINRQSILKLDEWGQVDAWTVCLGIEYSDPNASLPFPLFAELTVGAGGTTQKVIVDWAVGTCISLPMNALDVVAYFDQSNPVVIGSDLTPRLSVTMAQGATSQARSSYTARASTLSGSGTVVLETDLLELPPFSRRLEVQQSFLPSGGVQGLGPYFGGGGFIQFFTDDTASAIVGHVALGTNNYQGSGIPIPNQARFYRYYNDGTGGPVNPHAFHVAFIHQLF